MHDGRPIISSWNIDVYHYNVVKYAGVLIFCPNMSYCQVSDARGKDVLHITCRYGKVRILYYLVISIINYYGHGACVVIPTQLILFGISYSLG